MKGTWWALILVVAACEMQRPPFHPQQPDRYAALNEPPRPLKARADDSVVLYQAQVPDQPFVEVSMVTNFAANESEAIAKVKRSAATVGCDGIVLRAPQTEAVGIAGDLSSRENEDDHIRGTAVPTRVSLSGTCIMFRDDPKTWRPPAQRDDCEVAREQIAASTNKQERRRLIEEQPTECHTWHPSVR